MKACSSSLSLASMIVLAALAVAGSPPAEARPPPGRPKGRDTTPPTIVCPADITAEAVSSLGVPVWFYASAHDNVDLAPKVTYSIAPGSWFAIGTTKVTVTATDWKANTSTCSFNVKVQDTTAPVISCPADIIRSASDPGGSIVTFEATATDTVDPSPTISYSPASGSSFPDGTTTVTVTATDWKGNTSTCSFDVTYDDDPTDGPFAGNYSMSYFGYDASWNLLTWYDWSITIQPDGSVDGTGVQTMLLYTDYYYDGWEGYYSWTTLVPMPDGLVGTGYLSGHVTDAGALVTSGFHDEWVYDTWYGEYDNVVPNDLSGHAAFDASGDLVITDPYGGTTVWHKQ